MKRVLLLVMMAVLAVGCKKKEEIAASNAVQPAKSCLDTTPGSTDFVIPKIFDPKDAGSPSELIKQLHGYTKSEVDQILHHVLKDRPCTGEIESYAERIHSLEGNQAFFEYIQRRHPDYSGSYQYSEPIEWADMMGQFSSREILCYDGWLIVRYDSSVTPHQVSFNRSDTFGQQETLYSQPLFAGIETALRAQKATPLEVQFCKAICVIRQRGVYNDLEKIVFRVKYRNSKNEEKYEYYDMSDYPH